MDRFSRVSLWTLVTVILTASGCADVLGFKDFSDSDGGEPTSDPNNASPQGAGNEPNTTNESPGTAGSTGTSNSTGGNAAISNSGDTNNGGGTTAANDNAGGGSTTNDNGGGSSSTNNGGGTTTNNGGGTANNGGSSTANSGGGTTTNSGGGSSQPGGSGGGTTSSSSSKSTTGASSATSSSSSSAAPPPTSSSAASCTFGTPFNGDASFTFYFFGQGTAMSNGLFKTACGYTGTETGSGQSAIDTVPNAADDSPAKDTYFAAIPNTSGTTFNTADMCGACVEITNGGTSIVATVIDECPVASNPACESTGHLDLSTQAFDALGYSTGDPSGTTWKFVPCPEGTKNIQAVENSAGQYYLQSSVYPINTVNGQTITDNGFFDVNPGSATVTSLYTSQTITIDIPSGGGDTGANFTEPSGCF